jgi:hypothetical protein
VSEGHVYVVETKDGVKIGSSSIPERRIAQLFNLHKHKARFHISRKLGGYREAEGRAHLAIDGHRTQGEYFSVPFEKGVRVVEAAVEEVEKRKNQPLELMPVGEETAEILAVGMLHQSDDLNREVDVTLMVARANKWRVLQGKPGMHLSEILNSEGFKEFFDAVQQDMPGRDLMRKGGTGVSSRVYAHIYLAVYIAEQLSPEFHVAVIASFVDRKTNDKYRLLARLDDKEKARLRAGMGEYADKVEEALREKLLGPGTSTDDWNTASVAQTHARYEAEKDISKALQRGLVRDWDHLKELIGRL